MLGIINVCRSAALICASLCVALATPAIAGDAAHKVKDRDRVFAAGTVIKVYMRTVPGDGSYIFAKGPFQHSGEIRAQGAAKDEGVSNAQILALVTHTVGKGKFKAAQIIYPYPGQVMTNEASKFEEVWADGKHNFYKFVAVNAKGERAIYLNIEMK